MGEEDSSGGTDERLRRLAGAGAGGGKIRR